MSSLLAQAVLIHILLLESVWGPYLLWFETFPCVEYTIFIIYLMHLRCQDSFAGSHFGPIWECWDGSHLENFQLVLHVYVLSSVKWSCVTVKRAVGFRDAVFEVYGEEPSSLWSLRFYLLLGRRAVRGALLGYCPFLLALNRLLLRFTPRCSCEWLCNFVNKIPRYLNLSTILSSWPRPIVPYAYPSIDKTLVFSGDTSRPDCFSARSSFVTIVSRSSVLSRIIASRDSTRSPSSAIVLPLISPSTT